MLVWLTLPFYDFCGFRSVAVNSVYKLQLFYIYMYNVDCRSFTSLITFLVPVHQPPRSTQPSTLCGMVNEYQPKGGYALQLGSKGSMAVFMLTVGNVFCKFVLNSL